MLFNSYLFIFLFLPVTWIGWQLSLRTRGARAGLAWLTLASIVFYAWWDWRYAPLLLGSLLVNFWIARHLLARPTRGWLVAGLIWNLGLLGFFKYWNFFAHNAVALGWPLPLTHVALPLGISFFTFQKIAFLVDVRRGHVKSLSAADFSLFVMFFPQLIAGPIVHHRDFIPQLHEPAFGRTDARRCALGLTVFAFGLFQKSFVADSLAPLADEAFGLAANGTMLRLSEAWLGLLAYTVQLLYDFSGYSHMALGLALLFGLRLPVNFLAPYTAGSVIEFWRRWHMTLSAFLRDYVYIPLGGSRCAPPRHLANLFLTMVIGGFWHGAGWTFLVWGAWHGGALAVNHLWRTRRSACAAPASASPAWAHGLTLCTVLAGWVFFRAPNLPTAGAYLQSLVGWHGISVPVSWHENVQALAPVVRARGVFPNLTVAPVAVVVLVIAGYFALRGPRLLRMLGVTPDDVTGSPAWTHTELATPGSGLRRWVAIAAGVAFVLGVAWLTRAAPFLYFQF